MEKSEFIKVRGRNFICQLCDIKITSEKAVDDHLTGKKHQRLLSLQIGRQEQTQKSVFVGGLSRLNGELELGDYFATFGEVAQVFIDKEKAHYAIVEFASHESAQKATAVEKQLMNGHKIVVRPRQPKTSQPEAKGCRTPKSRVTGKGEWHGKGQNSREGPRLDETVCQRLQQEETVSDQMSTLVHLMELSQADQRLRRLICDLLQSVLEEFLPGCCVIPFGSSVNGFGVQGCDLDVHLDVSESTLMEMGERSTTADQVDGQNPSGSTDDRTIPDVASATPLDILALVSDVIKRCVPSCHNVHTIPSARLPVVKCTHKESGLQCDITLNNRLAVHNSKLLKFYSQLETQVRPLVFTIRQWAKLRQLAGNIGAGPRLTNYALTLMVLFYLQAKNKPLIPSVAALDQSGDGLDSVFSINKKIMSTTDNTQSQGDLLAGFFSFYDRFDFTTSVICPLSGKTASLSEALREGCDNSGRNFKSGAVNIQDPFELWHNVALNVNERTEERLSAECGIAAKLCQTELAWKQRGSSMGKPWGLMALFDLASSAKTHPSVGSTASTTDGAVVEINLKASHLSESFIAGHPDPNDLRSAWCVAVRKLAYRVLSEVLRFECCRLNNQEETCETASEQWQKDSECSTNSRVLESMPSGLVCTDAPADTAATARNSGPKVCEPPLSKRCRVDPRHSPTSAKQSLGDSSQEVPTSTQSAYRWSSATETLECKAYHHVWLGRRKARRQLKHKSQGGDQTATNINITKLPGVDQSGNVKCASTISFASLNSSSTPQDGPESLTSDNTCNLGEKHLDQTGSCQEFTRTSTGESSNASRSEVGSGDRQTDSQLVSDSFLMESQITDLIIAEKLQGCIASSSSVLNFRLELKDNISHGTTSVQMHFLPVIVDADFKVFLHFFDIFFKKTLDQCKI